MTDTDPRDDLRRLAHAMRLLVADEREAGVVEVAGLPAPPTAASTPMPSARPTPTARPPATPAAPAFEPRVPALELPADVLAPFGDLPARVAACTSCALCKSRTRTVFGEGAASARLVFCGEGPGQDEDRSGRPFVGPAGELLTRMIVNGLKMRREDVFILNAVKCRPPDNRTPQSDEIAACKGFLAEQLAVIRPTVIVALGNPACQALLGKVGITRLRGQVFDAWDAKVVPTYHPAFLLRSPDRRSEPWRQAWEDLQLVMRLLDAARAG
jgi:uracil-DNA glycosylase